ncbi:MAG: O-acetyltransferase, partial [Gemmatimonadetes bacterium]|nr:O-acetyltransferase [Gemmatimonadota bacterium]
GEGAMVGAGSVVIHDVPANTLVVGNPAEVVRLLEGGSRQTGSER